MGHKIDLSILGRSIAILFESCPKRVNCEERSNLAFWEWGMGNWEWARVSELFSSFLIMTTPARIAILLLWNDSSRSILLLSPYC